MIESGLDPDAKTFNMFFTKSDASISAANGVVRRPAHVVAARLRDRTCPRIPPFHLIVRSRSHAATLKDLCLSRVTIANDISARDVQLPQTQFFKGKSYRGFCPIGPWLTVLEPQEFALLDNLDLRLSVNGVLRQSDTTANLVFKPAETISELSTFANIAPGDVLLTGTPSGCALRVPPPMVRRLLQIAARTTVLGTVSSLHSAGAPNISSPATSMNGDDPQRRWTARPRRADNNGCITPAPVAGATQLHELRLVMDDKNGIGLPRARRCRGRSRGPASAATKSGGRRGRDRCRRPRQSIRSTCAAPKATALRLLSLLGAGKFPLVLGNDFAGTVASSGRAGVDVQAR